MRILACAAAVFSLAGAGAALAEGDVAAGQAKFRMCTVCHNIGEGAANKVGPVLNDVVGRQPGTYPGFAYSKAMVSFGEEHPSWTPDLLSEFLSNPRAAIPGTRMSFAGFKNAQDLENVIAYLISLSPDYVPEAGDSGASQPPAAPAN